MRVLVSLHDVTPAHRERLERAEATLARAGVTEVAYFLVPNYHGAWPVERDADFVRWCRRDRPYAVRWVLHGHYHREFARDRGSDTGVLAAAQRRFLTEGEGEFLALRGSRLRDRLAIGCAAFGAVLDAHPEAFVAPAWLFNDELPEALRAAGIRFTEDHYQVHDLHDRRSADCPAITWSARSAVRRLASRMIVPILLRRWSLHGAIRIALHPRDFDAPGVQASIVDALRVTLSQRVCASHTDLA